MSLNLQLFFTCDPRTLLRVGITFSRLRDPLDDGRSGDDHVTKVLCRTSTLVPYPSVLTITDDDDVNDIIED